MTLLFFGLAIVCRAISELALHGKLKWSGHSSSFWGQNSWVRKYKIKKDRDFSFRFEGIAPPDNWYYKLFNVKYREAWPTSATFTVYATDGYHLMQFAYHIYFSLGIWSSTGYPLWAVWPGVVFCHSLTYRLLSK